MYLKSLELSGFKSFAKKSELEFSSSIVAIVGPNGSGKSNVAEAFRFVLGEQSIKSMRGKRGEDLIFNGSQSVGKLGRAQVRLIFDNVRKIFNIDFPELAIERVVYRDGTNEYLLNGSKVRLKDVIELLAGANIGASGHHIISQGEADRILNASIRERREMIEDALGLKIYQYKLQESSRKLEKTTENIAQVNALRKEIAPHIRFLEKQVEKVKRAEGLKDELVFLYQDYLKREEFYLAHAKKTFAEEKKGPTEEKSRIEKRLDEIDDILKKAEKSDIDSHELLRAEKELRYIEGALQNLRREISRLDGEIYAEERLLARSKADAKSVQELSITLEEIEDLREKSEKILNQSQKEENPTLLKHFIEDLVSLLKNFVSEKKSKGGKADDIEKEERLILELKSKKTTKEREEKSELQKETSAKEAYELVKKRIEEGRVKGRDAEREMFTLMNRRTELIGLLASLSLREEELRREDEAFKSELQEAVALGGRPAISYSDLELPKDFLTEARTEQKERFKKLERVKVRLEEAGGAGGEEVLKEFVEVTKRDEFLSKEIIDLEVSAESLRGLIADLSEKLQTEFSAGVEKINKEFGKLFTLMFGGGSASLSVSEREARRKKISDLEGEEENEEEAEMESGIDIAVSLPNKRVKGLQMLSGGERALTSIALLFAISQVNPPPFIILDETDAALDEANSKKYGDMVESLSKHSQLILITHNRETMSRAGILYGVTMGGDGVSKLLSVKFDEAVAVAK